MSGLQKEVRALQNAVRREETGRKKSTEALEKQIENSSKQQMEVLRSLQATLLCDSSAPFYSTVRRKHPRRGLSFSQETGEKRAATNQVQQTVSSLVHTTAQKQTSTTNLFLVDDFFFCVCSKWRENSLRS